VTGADRTIRWSTAAAVISVAVVAAVVSYEHAYGLVHAHGEASWTAPADPAHGRWPHLGKLDGHARLGAPWRAGASACAVAPGPWDRGHARGERRARGLGHGPVGAAVEAWPAVALVGSYELLMMIIRAVQPEPPKATAPASPSAAVPHADPLHARAAREFAGEVAAGRTPSIRAIRARLRVGQPRAQQVQAHLGTLIDVGEAVEARSLEGPAGPVGQQLA
jgi:hypothetical protein